MPFFRRTLLLGFQARHAPNQIGVPSVAEATRHATEDAAWARANLRKAKDLMRPPPLPRLSSSHHHTTPISPRSSSKTWALERGWNCEPFKHEGDDFGAPERLLSHALTFPLTLAHYVTLLTDGKASSVESLTVIVVGARAEATLPPIWWGEVFAFLPSMRKLAIHFVGPEISSPQGGQLERQVISLESASDDANGDTPTEKFSVAERLLFLHYHRGTLCNFLDMATTIDREDGVCAASMLPLSASEGDSDGTKHAQRDAPDSIDRPILMWFSNPGFGHPSLRAGWEEDLRQVTSRRRAGANQAAVAEVVQREAARAWDQTPQMQQNRSGTKPSSGALFLPVLVTCNSAVDTTRDVATVSAAMARGDEEDGCSRIREGWAMSPQVNVFRSRRSVVDAVELKRNATEARHRAIPQPAPAQRGGMQPRQSLDASAQMAGAVVVEEHVEQQAAHCHAAPAPAGKRVSYCAEKSKELSQGSDHHVVQANYGAFAFWW